MIYLATLVLGFGLLLAQIIREEYRLLKASFGPLLRADGLYPPVKPMQVLPSRSSLKIKAPLYHVIKR